MFLYIIREEFEGFINQAQNKEHSSFETPGVCVATWLIHFTGPFSVSCCCFAVVLIATAIKNAR